MQGRSQFLNWGLVDQGAIELESIKLIPQKDITSTG